jgi:hypothetical protein
MKYETKLAINRFTTLKENFLFDKGVVMFCDIYGNEYYFNHNLSEDEFYILTFIDYASSIGINNIDIDKFFEIATSCNIVDDYDRSTLNAIYEMSFSTSFFYKKNELSCLNIEDFVKEYKHILHYDKNKIGDFMMRCFKLILSNNKK